MLLFHLIPPAVLVRWLWFSIGEQLGCSTPKEVRLGRNIGNRQPVDNKIFQGAQTAMSTFLATRQAMGTRFELALVGVDPAQLRAATEEALDEIEWLDRRWSSFRPDSEVSALNRSAARDAVRIEPRLMSLLDRARTLGIETDGALDPAVGALMAAWGFRGGPARVPTDEELARARVCCGMDKLRLDPRRGTVRYLAPGLQLDLGAVGKGAALDAAVDICRSAGVLAGLIHAGTSAIVAFGEPAPGRGWRVGIPRPEAARAGYRAVDLNPGTLDDAVWGEVELQDQALAISAVWGRTMIHSGISYGHVLDPRTGRPVDRTLMAAVLAPSGFEADAFSTALLVGGETLQARLAKSRPAWRSLLVARDPNDQPRLVNCGLI
jgi:FAD:protein FMN transferase